MTHHFSCKKLSQRSLLLIAPAGAALEAFHGPVTRSKKRHSDLISQIQRLRGAIYSEEGAIDRTSLEADGRHISPVDEGSWHLVTLNHHGEVLGCTRFRQHHPQARFQDLCLYDSGLAKSEEWGGKLRASISADMAGARKIGFPYVEIGGWALSPELRGGMEAVQSVLAIFAWSQALGGAIGVSTATERNGSASILRRLGGRPMQWDGCALPPYYDEQYQCGMEILRFDSRDPSARYARVVEELRHRIAGLEIIQDTAVEYASPRLPMLVPDLLPQSWTRPLAIAC